MEDVERNKMLWVQALAAVSERVWQLDVRTRSVIQGYQTGLVSRQAMNDMLERHGFSKHQLEAKFRTMRAAFLAGEDYLVWKLSHG